MSIFKRKKKRENLYFALVIANTSLDKAKFEMDQDCKLFITTGEIEKHDIVPRSVMKSMVEKFIEDKQPEGDVKISEATITEKTDEK